MKEKKTNKKKKTARKHKCISCGTTKNVTFGPDPYQSEINDDDTPVWMCDTCREESAMDI